MNDFSKIQTDLEALVSRVAALEAPDVAGLERTLDVKLLPISQSGSFVRYALAAPLPPFESGEWRVLRDGRSSFHLRAPAGRISAKEIVLPRFGPDPRVRIDIDVGARGAQSYAFDILRARATFQFDAETDTLSALVFHWGEPPLRVA